MNPHPLISYFFLIIGVFVSESLGKFILAPYNVYEITSQAFNYSQHAQEIDIIWRYSHSIQLEINYLQMDGQAGDFLLISDLPLTFEESFEEYNGSNSPPAFLADSIVTSQGLLLSWELEPRAKFQVLSKHGSFIYFHVENAEARSSFPFKGFNITVKDLDELRIPPTTTTTEGTRAPPHENVPIYTSKYLKNDPHQIAEGKEQLKVTLAQMATEYCVKDKRNCSELLSSDILPEEVSIPSDSGLRMCDVGWEEFPTCVEVTFAITREEDGVYLFPKGELDKMWELRREWLEGRNYFPMEPPPLLPNLNAWVWMASVLGIIFLFLLTPTCMFWIVRETHAHRPTAEMRRKDINRKGSEDDEDKRKEPSPLFEFLKKSMKRPNSEEGDTKYSEVGSSENAAASSSNYKEGGNTKRNVLFEDVQFEYDNLGFRVGTEDDTLYSRNGGMVVEKDFMSVEDEPFPGQSENRFLQIRRGTLDGMNSDTEI